MFFCRLEELHLSANNLHNLSNNVFQVGLIKGKSHKRTQHLYSKLCNNVFSMRSCDSCTCPVTTSQISTHSPPTWSPTAQGTVITICILCKFGRKTLFAVFVTFLPSTGSFSV